MIIVHFQLLIVNMTDTKIYIVLEHNPPGKSRVVAATVNKQRAEQDLQSFTDFPTGPSCYYTIQEQELYENG